MFDASGFYDVLIYEVYVANWAHASLTGWLDLCTSVDVKDIGMEERWYAVT